MQFFTDGKNIFNHNTSAHNIIMLYTKILVTRLNYKY